MEKVSAALLLCVTVSVSASAGDPPSLRAPAVTRVTSFLRQCVDLAELGIGLQCDGLHCLGEEAASLSLEELQHQACDEDRDCDPEHTKMTCSEGRCDCPAYTALNMSSCSCQQTSMCRASPLTPEDEIEPPCSEHNGRRCNDTYCSCLNDPEFKFLLVDPTSLFCVLPASPEELALGGGANSIGLAVLGALIGFLGVVIIAILIVATYKNCICERGDYKCDAPDGDIPEQHIAAWDHPSMDYISKDDENIIFTLCQASDSVRMSNASTIYVQDDETTSYIKSPGASAEHENMAYVEEEEPRND